MVTLAPLTPHQITKPKPKEAYKEGEMLLFLLEPTLYANHMSLKASKK